MSRREFGTALAVLGASAALPSSRIEASEAFSFHESPLSPEELDLHKRRSVTALRKSIPSAREVSYLHEHAAYLESESQMYIPTLHEIERVQSTKESRDDLLLLSAQIPEKQTGIFLFADIDKDGRLFQRLYVLRKVSKNEVQFEKGYLVSMAREGFGNEPGTNKTSLGLKSILSGEVGAYGEIVAAERLKPENQEKLSATFSKILNGRVPRWFAQTFGESPSESPIARVARDAAEVVTARYTIDEQRGIHIHGTNRSGWWNRKIGKWITLLGGRRRSTGCIRISNVDVYDLGLSGYIRFPGASENRRGGKIPGTPVMIHATARARGIAKPGEKIPDIHPDDKERNLFDEIDIQPPQEDEARVSSTPRSPRGELPRKSIPNPTPQTTPSIPKTKRRNLFDEI